MNIYEELGLKTIINASDTYTVIGGSRMEPEVLSAMAEAARHFVDLEELQERVGERLAELTRNEACYVTSGAAAGVLLSAAACMTGERPELAAKLPDSSGMRNEFLICACQKGQSLSFWHMIETAGGKIVWVDSDEAAFEAAMGDRTAGIFCFPGALDWEEALPLEVLVDIGRRNRIPVIVDAAAQLPPVERLWEYTRGYGADLAIFSGGKYIRGPQSTGMILGSKELIRACRINGSPNEMIGRPSKVGKEEFIGLLTALERLMSADFTALNRTYHAYLDEVTQALEGIPGIKTYKTSTGTLGQSYPLLIIELPEGMNGDKVHHDMRKGVPAIDIRCFFWRNEYDKVFVNPICLEPHEPAIIAGRLREHFLSEITI